MKVSSNWLRDFLPGLPRDPSQVAADLTRLGFEVEGQATIGRGVSGLRVGEVLGARPHPKADKLRIVRLRSGAQEEDVVCGAANVPLPEAGAPSVKVCWAPPGAVLPGFTMVAKEIRGVMSPGMLCSEEELGLAERAEGILILPADAPSGADPAGLYGFEDTVFEVNVTPNRADALSHLGLARELAAAYGMPLTTPISPPLASGSSLPAVELTIEDPRSCSRYQARVFSGVRVAPSPLPLRLRLMACGMRSLTNVVDVTNYVLLELGHPMHAFDLDKLEGAISVRKARAGERLETLDGVDRTLEPGDIVIADARGPVALAGVMGGAATEISETTRNVLLETATFDPVMVRRTAKRLALHSESSHRFERGVDAEGIPRAAARAAALISDLADGQQSDQVVDRYPAPPEKRRAFLSLATLRRLSGDPGRSLDQAEATLSRLCGDTQRVGQGDAARLELTVPSYRPDLTMEADLVEEVLRHEGYETVSARRVIYNAKSEVNPERLADRARRTLRGAGLHEIVSYGFVSAAHLAALGARGQGQEASGGLGHLVEGLKVANPLSAEHERMRTSLLPGLAEVAKRNLARGVEAVRLFEVGPVVRRKSPSAPEGGSEGFEQRRHVAALLCGPLAGWLKPGALVDFFDAKRVLETLLHGLVPSQASYFPDAEVPFLHPGVAARVEVEGKGVGLLGEVHPLTRKALHLETPAFFVELDLDCLPIAVVAPRPTAPPRFPATTRDVSFWVDVLVTAGLQAQALRAAAEPLLREVAVLEDFRDERYVPAGKKGMLWTLTYRADDRTLTDPEVDAAHARVLEVLKASFSLEIR